MALATKSTCLVFRALPELLCLSIDHCGLQPCLSILLPYIGTLYLPYPLTAQSLALSLPLFISLPLYLTLSLFLTTGSRLGPSPPTPRRTSRVPREGLLQYTAWSQKQVA